MSLMSRRSRRSGGSGARRERWLLVVLPLVALTLLFMPQSVTERIRVWSAPVLAPVQDVTQGWTLDLADHLRHPQAASRDAGELPPREQVKILENALAEATAMLNDYDRRVRELTRLRQDLNGLPCRLIPARFIAPEMQGGSGSARLAEGNDKGIRKGGAVIVRRLDRGAREALQRGEPVLTAAGLVGIVEEVGPLTSTLRLVTDPRTNLMVQVVAHRGDTWRAVAEGLARGTEDGTAIRVLNVDHKADIAPGDFVVTSPMSESLPPYLVVGRVVRCDLKPAALFYEVIVEPRVAPADAREVYVLTPDTQAPPTGR